MISQFLTDAFASLAAEIFFGITFRGRLGNRDFYSGYIFGFVGTLDVNLGLYRYSYKVYYTVNYYH
jgi:hypothetical protein